MAKALVNKGVMLISLNQSKDEIAIYDEVVRRFGDDTEPALHRQVAKALVNKGIIHGSLNQGKEEIAVYDEMVRRFGDATEPDLRELVAKALVNKGVTLGSLNQDQEAIAVYDEMVRRFGEATEPALRERVAMALVNKGISLLRQEKNAQAFQRFSEAIGFWEVNQGIAGQMNKVVALSGLQRFDEAEHLLKQLLEKTSVDLEMVKDFLSDLEAMASATQPLKGIRQFLESVKYILKMN